MITKNELIEQSRKTGIDLGKTPGSNLAFYEIKGILPRVRTTGLGKGKGKLSFYPSEALEILKKAKYLQDEGCLLRLVRKLIRQEFKDVFFREDLLMLTDLNSYSKALVELYLKEVGKAVPSGVVHDPHGLKEYLLRSYDAGEPLFSL